ncbi:MAG: hypothetical protein JXL20_07610 [Deltaproteobacteria bacterium]|nr:hypothetical protein [Deltaproteobacteria bacterium]
MKHDYRSVIRTLIREQESSETGSAEDIGLRGELTSLGVPLVRRGEHHFSIDLSNVHVFRNLHTFVQLLTNEVLEQCGFGTADIMVRRKVDPNLTPELVSLGLDWVMIYARIDAAESLPFYNRYFTNCMQVIFRTLQTERWGGLFFPDFFNLTPGDKVQTPLALLFPFHLQEAEQKEGQYFLVEYNPSGRFLRITIEDAISSRLQLKHISHRVVDQLTRPSYLPNVYLIAEQIHQGILRECMNYRTQYDVMSAYHRDLFDHLNRCGLTHLQKLQFTWPTDDIQTLLIEKQGDPETIAESFVMLVKVIQMLEDPLVISRLVRGDTVEMVAGRFNVFIDLSRYGACLNFSFDERRSVFLLEDYLERMPVLSRSSQLKGESLDGVHLFLIHHITAEVIGLLKAFHVAGCPSITTFFVKYAGIVPDSYLETLMSLPQESFRFYSLQKLESRQQLSGRYILSRLFTPVAELSEMEKEIYNSESDFFRSMRLAAGHLFMNGLRVARQKGEQMLLVEDGGYLAPLLNRFCLEGASVSDVFAYFRAAVPEGQEKVPLAEWMKGIFLGSVEHTRNGYDYNAEVANEFGRLEFPVASIAVSNLKRGPEAKECAISILNAAENILHRLGMLFSRRKILILGSSGAIGSFLKMELRHRIDPAHLCGVDIAVRKGEGTDIMEVSTLDELGHERLAQIDMVIGVIGASIFRKKQFEEMVLRGHQKEIFFISGSTKTVEFSDLEACLQSLRNEGRCPDGMPVTVEYKALRDLQTGILQGYRLVLSFHDDPSRDKNLYLLGELMPINFLYYGIPREIVDEVMAQLFTLSCGVARRQRSADKLPPKLLAVDRQIDADANDIIIRE